MTQKTKIFFGVVALALLAAGGVFVYFSRPVAAPSADIEAVTPSLERIVGTPETSLMRYRITREGSEAQFSVGEILRGSFFTAIGKTQEIGGEIVLNSATPSASEVGVIRVNARTLKTDSPQRDGAIARLILRSEDAANEFIEFRPTNISGMPEKLEEAAAFSFMLAGDLTISGITKPATFEGVATLAPGGNTLAGAAFTTVTRSDFGLKIPNVPFVASVDEAVRLDVTLTAEHVYAR